jgi:hypothetical protein
MRFKDNGIFPEEIKTPTADSAVVEDREVFHGVFSREY